MSEQHIQLEANSTVRAWLNAHPTVAPRVIAYDVRRCCGGGKICQVKVRELSAKDDPGQFATGVMDDGTKFLIVAGLLNFISVADAYHIAIGKKP